MDRRQVTMSRKPGRSPAFLLSEMVAPAIWTRFAPNVVAVGTWLSDLRDTV
jgi:hypothetical protein